MKIKNVNEKGKCIGLLLKHDYKDNIQPECLNHKKLDYSFESLKYIDDYLNRIRKNKKKLSKEQKKILILRCGTYVGEVVRKHYPKKFIWISFDEACKVSKDFSKVYGGDITSGLVIYNIKSGSFWLPLNKVYKFLKYGKSDSLKFFAEQLIAYKE